MPELTGKYPEISKLWSNFFFICNEAYKEKWRRLEDWEFLDDLIHSHLIPILIPVKGYWKIHLIRISLGLELIKTNKEILQCIEGIDFMDTLKKQNLLKMKEGVEEIERQLCLNQGKTNMLELMKRTLLILIKNFEDSLETKYRYRNQIEKAMIEGRLEKLFFELEHTVIIGDDGGWYILINTVNGQKLNCLLEDANIPGPYLISKIKQQGPDNYQFYGPDWYKIVIGVGSFGRIRLGISLLPSEKVKTGESILAMGEVICLKKSRSLLKVTNTEIRMNVWNDYVSDLVGKNIHSPEIYDMVIIKDEEKRHCKGYTMQQFIAVYDGTIFMKKNSGFQRWTEQKIYFLDIFDVIIDLLDHGVCMSDLKPSNTLYDIVNKVGKLIDLAGCVKKNSILELQKCKRKYVKEYSEGFTAPEILQSKEDPEEIVDLAKAITFSMGRMIQRLILIEQDNILNLEDKCPNIHELKELIKLMTLKNPRDRLEIRNAQINFQKIGPNYQKNLIDFSDFVAKMQEIIFVENYPDYFGLKKDVVYFCGKKGKKKIVEKKKKEKKKKEKWGIKDVEKCRK